MSNITPHHLNTLQTFLILPGFAPLARTSTAWKSNTHHVGIFGPNDLTQLHHIIQYIHDLSFSGFKVSHFFNRRVVQILENQKMPSTGYPSQDCWSTSKDVLMMFVDQTLNRSPTNQFHTAKSHSSHHKHINLG